MGITTDKLSGTEDAREENSDSQQRLEGGDESVGGVKAVKRFNIFHKIVSQKIYMKRVLWVGGGEGVS